MRDIRLKLPPIANIALALLSIVLFLAILVIGASILIPLAFGGILSIFLYPMARRLQSWGLGKGLAILICMLGVIMLLTVVFTLIYNNLRTFSADYPRMRERVLELISLSQRNIEEYFDLSAEQQLNWLNDNLAGFVRAGGNLLNGFVSSAGNFFTQLLLIPIYIYFLMYYRHVVKGFVMRVVPTHHIDKALHIEAQIVIVTQRYITGLFTVILIVSVLNIVGLWAIGIPHAIFFGVLAGLLTVIPYIGVFIGSTLPILYALVMTDSIFYPIAVFSWFQVVQAVEGNFITPNVVGAQVNLNPMVAIIALLIGANVWGVAGMILFTPYTALLKVVLDNIPTLSAYGYLLSEGDKPARRPSPSKAAWWQVWKRKR